MAFRWYHTQIWLYGHWLPGDPRGFRSRDHRLHSSGDYKHRPPRGEHDRLRSHAKSLLKQEPISLTDAQRELVGGRIVRWFDIKPPRLAAVAVGAAHTHLLCELPTDEADVTIGKVKRYASTEASRRDATLPAKLFAAKGEPKPVRNAGHFVQVYPYIVDKHAAEGAWTWGVGIEGAREMFLGGRSGPRP